MNSNRFAKHSHRPSLLDLFSRAFRRAGRSRKAKQSRPAVRLLLEQLESRITLAADIVTFVNGQDADTPTGPHVAAGSTVTFTYVVTNTGSVPLANVVVTDDKLGTIAGPASGDANTNGLLDLTETWTYTTTATALAGQQTNVGTVTALETGTPVTDNNPGNYFGDVPAINIVKFVNGQDADTPTGPHVPAGSTVTFTYVVTNTGNVPLANVSVADDKLGAIAGPASGDTNGNGLLDLTETWIYTTTATALAGQQTNVGTVSGQDSNNPPGTTVTDTNPGNYFGDAPGVNIVKFVNGQDADTPSGARVAVGSTVTFTYVVTNTGNVPLANVVVTDDKLGPITSFTGDTNGNGLLDLTETWTYTQTATALAGQQTNVGTATANDANNPPGTPVTDDNPANYFGGPGTQIVKFVNGQDADTPTGPHLAVGSTVTFTYVVTNPGTVPLANVVVTDDKLGPITSFTGDANNNGLLDLTETWTYTTTATALAGQQTNVGTVTGLDPTTGTTVTDNNPANYFGDAPATNIVKFVNGQDADTPTGPHVTAGSTVTFTYVVTNTGNVPLANVAVTDDKLGTIAGPTSGDTNGNGLLDLTETWIYTTTATALAGQQTNVGTVTGQDANNPPGTTVTDNNPANYFGDAPAINIVKFVNGQDADSPAGPHVAVGSTVTFTYVVTNTGNVPLANVAVSDDKLGPITSFTGDTNSNGLLDLTETWTYTTTAIALAGQQTNVGTVTGQDPNIGTTVTDNNPGNYFGDAPGVNIVKFVNGQDADSPTGPHVAVGSTVTFTYVVTNTGNVPLANVAVTDDKLGTIAGPASGDTNGNGLLDLTETWIYTRTATAVPGQQTNVGTVTGQDANNPPGTTVTDTNPGNYFGDAPGVNIVKFINGQDADSPTGPHVAAGSTVTFTYVVTNTGNVPLANVAVSDDKLGTITGFTGDTNGNGLLDLTETWTYTTNSTALAGQQTNLGTVSGQDANNPPGTTVTDNNPGNYFGDAPAINIVKFVNGEDADGPTGPHVDAGSTVTFTYVVTNTGNVPLANVAVTDDKLGSITSFTGDTNGNGLLDLTETWTYTQTATALAGQQTNLGTVTGQDANNPPGTTVTDDNPANYFGDTFDFGDAPDSYPTLLASGGPRHLLGSTLFLGATVDPETDGQPSPDALGDDTDADGDDEDGVSFVATLIPHLDAVAVVNSSEAGFVDAWVDFNGDGVFGAGEQIAASFPVIAGNNNILFSVPASVVAGTTFARFRVSSTGGLSPTGLAADGEVEDHTVRILACPDNSAQVVGDPANPGQKILLVCGTNNNDVLIIEPRPINNVQVRVKNSGQLLGIANSSAFQSIAVFGKAGNDIIIVDARINKPAQLFGEGGNDQLFGAGGADRLHGGSGNDKLFGGNNNDVLSGDAGDDFLYGQNGSDTLQGGDGNDQMWGEAGNDRMFGGIGNDLLAGGAANDLLFGEAGNDKLFGDAGNDVVVGGGGSDLVYGGQGRDILIGGNGSDTLFGEQGDDILVAGPTAHDTNELALLSIMAEWASSHTYNARVNNIRTGGGLTGGFAFNGGTVADDGVVDTLWGKDGQDWFLRGVGDLLKDKSANELVN